MLANTTEILHAQPDMPDVGTFVNGGLRSEDRPLPGRGFVVTQGPNPPQNNTGDNNGTVWGANPPSNDITDLPGPIKAPDGPQEILPLAPPQTGDNGTTSAGTDSGTNGTTTGGGSSLDNALVGMLGAGGGASISPPVNAVSPVDTASGGGSSSAIIIIILLVAAVGGFYWWKHHKKGQAAQ